ncbi:MAG: prephenate dehydrogenase/arogenate dehydrogenase family protein [Bacteroidales bacterium]|nr:prephenate dehydrogenase/arogenate dehydrogenase family protein [Bacteroidales bacterium]
MSKKVVSVYGYGRFGKLWADILAPDFHVKVYSRRGLKAEEVDPGLEISSESDIFNCDAIFFCVAISSFEQVLLDTKKYHNPNTLFFDTCSVKVFPAKWMLEHLPEGSKIIATHPMFGPDSYYEQGGRNTIVMCNLSVDNKEFIFWQKYFARKKMHLEVMTPDEHDKKVAYSQGITHYIGRVLGDLNLEPTMIDTLGYEKLMEIIEQTCNDSWQLFLDLQTYNPYTKDMREELYKSIEKIYAIFDIKPSNSH